MIRTYDKSGMIRIMDGKMENIWNGSENMLIRLSCSVES